MVKYLGKNWTPESLKKEIEKNGHIIFTETQGNMTSIAYKHKDQYFLLTDAHSYDVEVVFIKKPILSRGASTQIWHRLDGPARIRLSGEVDDKFDFWINDQCFHKRDWEKCPERITGTIKEILGEK